MRKTSWFPITRVYLILIVRFKQKFADNSVPKSEIDSELQLCHDYLDKIESCLPFLGVDASRLVSLTDGPRSLLKQPTAPLPKFCSSKNEDNAFSFRIGDY